MDSTDIPFTEEDEEEPEKKRLSLPRKSRSRSKGKQSMLYKKGFYPLPWVLWFTSNKPWKVCDDFL